MAGERTRVAAAEVIVRDRTGPGIRSASSNFQQLHAAVRYNMAGINALGSAFAGIGAVIAGGFTVAVKAAAEFETGMAGVARTTRGQSETAKEAVENSQALAQSLRDLAKAAPVSVGRLTAIAEEAGALGIARQDITAFTKTIVELVATTNLTDKAATQLARISGVMGITADEVGGLGSAILFMGRSTAATETEIVHFAQFLAPVIRAANGTTSELIALSAVLPSLGQRAESSRTAVQKTIFGIEKAMRAGGAEAARYAAVTGKSVEELKKITAANGVQGLMLLVEGFSRVEKSGKNLGAVMDDLGIKDARYIAVLKALTAGVGSRSNAYLDLRRAMEASDKALMNNTELTEAYAVVTGTAAAKFTMLKNNVYDLTLSLGNALLPTLSHVIGYLQSFVAGFNALPGPVKNIIALVVSVTGVLGAMIGVAAFVVPRMILVKGALLEAASAYAAFARSGANSAAILATANNSTALSTIRAAAAYGRMNPAALQAEFQAYKTANAQQVVNAIYDQAVFINNALGQAVALEARIETLAAQQKGLNAKATQMSAAAAQYAALGHLELAAAIEKEALSYSKQAAVIGRQIAATRGEVASIRSLIVAKEQDIAITTQRILAIQAETAATTRAAVASGLFGRALAGIKGKAAGTLGVLLLLATVVLPLLGRATQDASIKAAQHSRYQADLAKALGASRSGNKNAIAGFIALQLAQINGIEVARALGIQTAALYAIINGTASPILATETMDKLAQAHKNGNKGAAGLSAMIVKLHNSLAGQAGAAKSAGSSLDGLGKDAADAKKKLDDLRKTNDEINNALLALPRALLSQRAAALAVADAQDEYNEALNASKNHAQDLRDAQDRLTKATLEHRQALRDVSKAEIEVGRARQKAADLTADAEDNLKDAQDRIRETQQGVVEAEEELAKLRSGPSTEELTKATNKLADANLKLRNSQFAVRDAQYMLNYLQAEGASARDLEEAQFNLDEANQDVANSTMNVVDATNELNDLKTVTPQELAEAEADLAEARREAAEAVRDLRGAEQDLADARTAQANDDLYVEATDNLAQARLDASEAARELQKAEKDLLDTRKNVQSTRALAKAQLALEEALYAQAEANVEVQKQMALSRGEQFGAGRQAKALAGELRRLGLTASGPIAADFAKFSGILSGARADIGETDDALDDFGAGLDTGGIIDQFEMMEDPIADAGEDAGKGFIERMIDYFKEHGVESVATGLIAMMVAAILIVVGAPVWLAVAAAALIVALVYFLYEQREKLKDGWDKLMDYAVDFKGWVGKKIEEARVWVGNKLRSFGTWMGEQTVKAFEATFGRLFRFNDWINKKIEEFRQWIGEKLRAFGDWIARKFVEGMIAGLNFAERAKVYISTKWNEAVEGAKGFFKSKGTMLAGLFVGALLGGFSGLGSSIGRALTSSLSGVAGYLKGPINAMIRMFNNAIENIADTGFGFGGSWGVPRVDIDLGFVRNFKIPELRMAAGGITNGRQVRMLRGESGAEAVLPLDRLYAMLAPLDIIAGQLAATNQALRTLSGGDGTTHNYGDTFNIYANDADALEIAEEVVWKKLVRK